MKINKWKGRVKSKTITLLAKPTKYDMVLKASKYNDFARENNTNVKKNKKMLEDFRELAKMFIRE